ncbi:MAG: hypothetical protein HOC91_09095 [Nitrospinaceae bacterium]|nr:hypothetical protein [Nitrospinaceae bacterium]MBT3434537.1 hypothetical protein [Nitrospinaceae bacterium]MBT4093142.1 hypothetical protein [Nitrospinaceae bacterium]MBT4430655.1 hypothetical protein [Nitrospinaceae bacterium]MBT5369731.1 hypothetical protein [Nitrospinaceae bacterium]
MAKIPEFLHEPVSNAFPKNPCFIGTVQPDGWAQFSPRGSVVVLDEETIGYWDRGSGSTHDGVEDGSKVMVFFRSPELGASRVLPLGGIARFYGIATVHNEGAGRELVWNKMIEHERDKDPEKKGRAVILKIERAEDLYRKPLQG